MKVAYVPILKALQAEFTALGELRPHVADSVFPLFEIARLSDSIRDKACYRETEDVTTAYLVDVCRRVATVWDGRKAMFDTYHWAPDATIEDGQHVVPFIYAAMGLFGIEVTPVIGYDRWGVEEYQLALKTVRGQHRGEWCLRLDVHAFEDAAEPDYFRENVEEILADLDLDPAKCRVMLDFGDATSFAVADMLADVEAVLELLTPYGFSTYSVAGCSLPKTIDGAVKTPDSCGTVVRREMLLWRALRQQNPTLPMQFGDYGVRGPNSNEGVQSKHTNGKIRYTIEKVYYVARGHSMSLPGKGEQMWGLAQAIIDSGHYQGSEFSWGDDQIEKCANREFKGHAAQWISIDTNHHVAMVTLEVAEFERQIAAAKAR